MQFIMKLDDEMTHVGLLIMSVSVRDSVSGLK